MCKESEDVKKSYYAIIPADVRYDKNLTANAKLLYGEITALCQEKGFCWASNSYFTNLYKVSPQAVSRWIKSLEACKYLSIEYMRKGKEIVSRKIIILPDRYQYNVQKVSINSSEGINKKLTRYQQIVKENNTINNTSNNTINNSDFELFWKAYPKKVAKAEAIKSYNKKLKVLPEINKHIEIIKNWCNTEQWKKNFIPNPTTWLNQERWNDEIVLSAEEQKKKERLEAIEKIKRGEFKE